MTGLRIPVPQGERHVAQECNYPRQVSCIIQAEYKNLEPDEGLSMAGRFFFFLSQRPHARIDKWLPGPLNIYEGELVFVVCRRFVSGIMKFGR